MADFTKLFKYKHEGVYFGRKGYTKLRRCLLEENNNISYLIRI